MPSREKAYEIHKGDCLDVLRGMADNSADSIVTDPPYGIRFMGAAWDGADIEKKAAARRSAKSQDSNAGPNGGHNSAAAEAGKYDLTPVAMRAFQEFSEAWAREVFRVLKPGGHLLSFASTRTYHRMVCGIEDAGFEIRDGIAWVFSTGFPKSMNLDRKKGEVFCGCEETAECEMRHVQRADVPAPVASCKEQGQVLQQGLPQQGVSVAGRTELAASEVWREQSSMEGRCDATPSARELCASPVLESTGGCTADGPQGRICNGASPCDGAMDRSDATQVGGCSSHRPSTAEQPAQELGALAGQPESQAMGTWPTCGGCGKPRIPSGLGTALKPAHEPIVVARKPMIGTVVSNVLAHGTGALNIDACRVPGEKGVPASGSGRRDGDGWGMSGQREGTSGMDPSIGRFPANLLHDGSDCVVAFFPESAGAGGSLPQTKITGYGDGIGTGKSEYIGGERTKVESGTGSAARFFNSFQLDDEDIAASKLVYCPKASGRDRHEGLENPGQQFEHGATLRDIENTKTKGNNHPTVKPFSLMLHLIRLITPPGGTVVDPFGGSGSTGKAAILGGFYPILIERDDDGEGNSMGYIDIIRARCDHAVRMRDMPVSANDAKAAPIDAANDEQGDLFGGAAL